MLSSKAVSILCQQSGIFRRAGTAAAEAAVKAGKISRHPKGTVLFRQGAAVKDVYFLLEGNVSSDLDGLETSELYPGSLGGATGVLLPDAKHSQTHTVASESADTLTIEKNAFVDLIDNNRDFRNSIIVHFSNKNRKKNTIIAQKFIPSVQTEVRGEGGKSLKVTNIAVFDAKAYDIKHLKAAFEGKEVTDDNTVIGTDSGSASHPASVAESTGKPIKSEAIAKAAETKCPKGTFHLKFIKSKLNNETAPLAAGCQAACIFVNDTADGEVLQILKAVGVEVILLRCVGFNNVDLEVAQSQKLTVMRVPAYSPHAVAEHAAALLLSLNRRIHTAFLRVRFGNFTLRGLEGSDLHGLTCGVLGTGKIGQVFATIANGFGMKVILWDKFPNQQFADKIGAKYMAEMDDIFPHCDVISLHVPLTKQTKHLINKDRIDNKLKKGVLIINTSRGPIVDAEALCEGLLSGKVGGAGLDVYENEKEFFYEDRSDVPIRDATLARLIGMPNVLITSHQAFFTNNALGTIGVTTALNANEYFVEGKRGKALTNAVLPEGFDPVTVPAAAAASPTSKM